MQDGIEPPPIAALHRRRPRISSRSLGIAFQIENMDDAFPDQLALKNLFDGQLGDQNSRAPVLGFDGPSQFLGTHIYEPILARFNHALFPH